MSISHRDSDLTATEEDLFFAILGPRAAGGPRRLMLQLQRSGRQPVRSRIATMASADIANAESEAVELSAGGVRVLVGDDPRYPDRLRLAAGAPPALFYRGAPELLDRPCIGVCGSRNASINGLSAARACGEDAANAGVTVVSGYAKGVDTESHLASLSAGGGTIAVLAEGITHFRLKKPYRELPASAHERLLVISQFPPNQGWTIGAAMTRNRVIVGLSPTVVVVEAGETGGTLKAGELAIQQNRRLLVLGFADGDPDGNKKLIAAGGHRVPGRSEMVAELARLRDGDGDGGNQLTLV